MTQLQNDQQQQQPPAIQVMPVTEQQASAWIGLANTKNGLVANLMKFELQLQGILNGLEGNQDHEQIDSTLAVYKKEFSKMVETRKGFTNMINEKIVEPLMAFEKRVDPAASPEFSKYQSISLALRKKAKEEAERINNINNELGTFKAFVTQEYHRIAAEYEFAMRNEIITLYAQYLERRITPTKEFDEKHLQSIQVPPIGKFTPYYLTYEQMQQAHASIVAPDWAMIYQRCIKFYDETFANFDSDLANADAAIKHAKDQELIATANKRDEVQQQMAVAQLVNTSSVATVSSPKIKVKYQIEVVESFAWAKTVMVAFMMNESKLQQYIRVKSFEKLNIGQMAEYLAKLATNTGHKELGLNYIEIEK